MWLNKKDDENIVDRVEKKFKSFFLNWKQQKCFPKIMTTVVCRSCVQKITTRTSGIN